MFRFFASRIDKQRFALSAEESRHLVKVLRLNVGDEVEAIDGSGILYLCKVIAAKPQEVLLNQIDVLAESKQKFGVSLAVAPTKNVNRWEWFLEKATEIGIDGVFPLLCYNSERKVIKMDRQERILKSAVKQSHKLQLPLLSEMQKFGQFIQQPFEGKKYIAHCYSTPKTKLSEIHSKGENALILIGPEGDFSQSEVDMAIKNGFEAVSLSESRLRTETAAIVACNIINIINA